MSDIIDLSTRKPVTSSEPVRENCCGNCAFMEFSKDNVEQGVCHSKPPQLIVLPGQNPLTGQMVINVQSMYPVVKTDSWCGDFEHVDGSDDGKLDS